MEKAIKCKYGALPQDGSRSLSTLMSTSATTKTEIDALMFYNQRMRKDNQFRL
jgi:hypothetical protein